jgi:hypothetical protein
VLVSIFMAGKIPHCKMGLNWVNVYLCLAYCGIKTNMSEQKSLAEPNPAVTCRRILMTIRKIFDPIGFSWQVTLYPKLVIHNIWNLKSDWDKTLLEEQRGFEGWVAKLTPLYEVRIPRRLTNGGSKERWRLHTFCDASKVAYTAVGFLRPTMGR